LESWTETRISDLPQSDFKLLSICRISEKVSDSIGFGICHIPTRNSCVCQKSSVTVMNVECILYVMWLSGADATE